MDKREVVRFEGDVASFTLMSDIYSNRHHIRHAKRHQIVYVMMVYVSSVLVAMAVAVILVTCLNGHRIVARNLWRFNRVWVDRPLLFLRGLTAVLMLSLTQVALEGHAPVTALQFTPRSTLATMVVAGEASNVGRRCLCGRGTVAAVDDPIRPARRRGALELFTTPLFDPQDPSFHMFDWMVLSDWATDVREVVRFDGDVSVLHVITEFQSPVSQAINYHEVPTTFAMYARTGVVMLDVQLQELTDQLGTAKREAATAKLAFTKQLADHELVIEDLKSDVRRYEAYIESLANDKAAAENKDSDAKLTLLKANAKLNSELSAAHDRIAEVCHLHLHGAP
ncbi:hypothetical protein DYB34_006975 [Aphanomyces astaci]|uniref:Uncharacterized protein n=1 Tax=Aphanomyces astaci TaxID=112090 RepID=A0A418C517_APHAT|nr:hypothetical protein DYB34_006975 [Aphanomyces astaci]